MNESAQRRAELARRLSAVRDRISRACETAERDAHDVTLIVVTKTFPASDIELLADLGVHDVAENKHQEAAPKRAACADLPLRWHFVGQLQTNKATPVASYSDVVHSVDRLRLLEPLRRGAQRRGHRLGCLVQVHLGRTAEHSRAGVPPEHVPALAGAVAAMPELELLGLMAVAPLDAPPEPAFDRLADLSARIRRDHQGAGWLSAGMSADLEAAVEAGATHVRIGSAVLGARPSFR